MRFNEIQALQGGAPQLAKFVQISPISRVYGTYNDS